MPDDEEVEVKVKPETGSSKKADEGATKNGNVSANWKRWVLKWTMYELATGLDTKIRKVRIAAMLSSVGQDGLDLFQTFEWKDENELRVTEPSWKSSRSGVRQEGTPCSRRSNSVPECRESQRKLIVMLQR
ncbi:hypothetical protein Ocin01_19281 [Orchesella cincta]|uniref:Uncharacterized protein n=1 Tax=Orchesella cincta TaxID=48709 RepID=A0A1D2M3B3_ORCCI|nr:hypothetical protein Ocin01_19281 [Orchesella cincta]